MVQKNIIYKIGELMRIISAVQKVCSWWPSVAFCLAGRWKSPQPYIIFLSKKGSPVLILNNFQTLNPLTGGLLPFRDNAPLPISPRFFPLFYDFFAGRAFYPGFSIFFLRNIFYAFFAGWATHPKGCAQTSRRPSLEGGRWLWHILLGL